MRFLGLLTIRVREMYLQNFRLIRQLKLNSGLLLLDNTNWGLFTWRVVSFVAAQARVTQAPRPHVL